jgi:transposase, IS5 family
MKAWTIPWLEIEKRYAKLFTKRKRNAAKTLWFDLRASIIQAECGYSDEETSLAPLCRNFWVIIS